MIISSLYRRIIFLLCESSNDHEFGMKYNNIKLSVLGNVRFNRGHLPN